MRSIAEQLYNKNPLLYKNNPGRLNREAETFGRLNRAYTDPLSPTKGNAMASAMNTLRGDDTIGGVRGARIKEDLRYQAAANATRRRLNRLSGDDLNDELKRMDAMTPRVIAAG